MNEDKGDQIVEVKLSTGNKYKIREVSLETGFDWLEIEKTVTGDTKAMIREKLKFFVVEPKLTEDLIKKLRMKEGIELVRQINWLNGIGDFTQSRGKGREQVAGKDTMT
jgi:hypothetical protein